MLYHFTFTERSSHVMGDSSFVLSPLRRSRFLRRLAGSLSLCLAWTTLAPGIAAAAPQPSPSSSGTIRPLRDFEMERFVGSQSGGQMETGGGEGGGTQNWEGGTGGGSTPGGGATPGGGGPATGGTGETNTVNGNKITPLPIVSWRTRGGGQFGLALFHNSRGVHNGKFGHKWTCSFDNWLVVDSATGNVTVHMGDDQTYAYTRNVDGSFTAPSGVFHTLAYDSATSAYSLTTKGKSVYRYTNPNSTGWLCTRVTDRNGNQTNFAYNSGDWLTSASDPTGRSVVFAYDASNKVTSVTDPLGRVWTFAYNGAGDLASVTFPQVSGQTYSTTFGYSASHNITSLTNNLGKTTTFTYDGNNRLLTETNPLGHTTTIAYGSTTRTITGPNSNSTVHTYDSSGRLVSVTDPLGHVTSFAYDANNNRTGVTTPRGTTTSTYDSRGNVLTATNALGQTTTFTYNAQDLPLTVTTHLGRQTTYGYDANGNRTSVTDPLNHTTTFAYDGYGQPVSTTDATGKTSTIDYDANGNPLQAVHPSGKRVTFTYNTLGWPLTEADARGNTKTTTYDDWGRPTSVTGPDGVTIASTVYNAANKVVSVTDGKGNVAALTYDDLGRVVTATNAKGEVTTNAYDALGQIGFRASHTNAKNETTSYAYTLRGQLASVSYADGTGESWTYAADGLAASHTDGNGATVQFLYDATGRLSRVDYPTGTDVVCNYDADGQRTSMSDASGLTLYGYDAAGRVTGIDTPRGTLAYTYDNAGRRTLLSLSGVGGYADTHDTLGRLAGATNPFGETTTYTRNADGLVTLLVKANGARSEYDYDGYSRLTQVAHKTAGGTLLERFQYQYDLAGNTTQKTELNGSVTTYTYDAIHQLTGETRTGPGAYTIGYAYDANGNRTGKTVNGVTESYTYGPNDRLLTAGNRSYSYDNNGNTTAVTVGSQTTSLTYDYDNRIKTISYPGGATNSFTYNGQGLRVAKADSAGTTAIVTDGTAVASPVLSDGAAVYTPGVSERRGSASKFSLEDGLGSTSALTDASLTVTDTLSYDAFGQTVSRTGTTPTPFGFAATSGYQTDGDSSLMLLGHRYYDASIGRFLTRDPAKDGRNWYAYASNNPLSGTDPTGQWIETALDIAGLILDVKDFIEEPSIISGAMIVGDVIGIVAPGIPSPGAIKGAIKIGGKVGDVVNDLPPPSTVDDLVPPGHGVSPGGCFVAGTPILMADGTSKPIEEVRAGDKVLSRSEDGKQFGAKTVSETYVRKGVPTLKVHLSSGQVIETTQEHPFYVDGEGFVPAGRLSVGTSIVTRVSSSGKTRGGTWYSSRITRIEATGTRQTVYNCQVQGFHTYFVGTATDAVWVHNTDTCNLDPNRDWRWHYTDQPGLDKVGINPGPGTDRVFVTDLMPEVATPDITSGLINRPVTHAYPIDVTDLPIYDAGPGFAGASDEFLIGSIPTDRIMPPFVL
jgi:RHS repeat-associated protein